MNDKYESPYFMKDIKDNEEYKKWLIRKAMSQFKRDKDFYEKHDTKFPYERIDYKEALHFAVINSGGLDYYTGKPLDWHLISAWDNDRSMEIGYKKKFNKLPVLEHVNRDDLSDKLEFVICGWAVSDAKNDLNINEFLELCQDVLSHSKNNEV